MLRMRTAVGITALLVSGAAIAEPVDCDKLVHTTVPFELRGKDQDGKPIVLQIYRHASADTVRYVSQGGSIQKTTHRGYFLTSSTKRNGPLEVFQWSKAIDGTLPDTGRLEIQMSRLADGKTAERADYVFTGKGHDEVQIAGCRFPVTRTTVDVSGPRSTIRIELWFSKPLSIAVRYTTDSTINGTARKRRVDYDSISTNFTPLTIQP